jgi:ribosomal protein S18 acetylase RimI-like enzyme
MLMLTRPALPADHSLLSRLLRSTPHCHTHLDWQPPEAWLGTRPFYLAFDGNKIVGALAATPDPPDVGWVRLAAAEGAEIGAVLDALWQVTRETLIEMRVSQIVSMMVDDWFVQHLARWGFAHYTNVVVLARRHGATKLPATPGWPPILGLASAPRVRLRPAKAGDLPAIAEVDNAAFTPPWQYSLNVVQQALAHADCATMAEMNGRIAGYQISSGGRQGGHLARLAVRPEYQGQGVGRALVSEVIRYFEKRNAPRITVNTQSDNESSLAVYRSLGFELTGESYAVWRLLF